MGFFENNRIKKQIAELEIEIAKLEKIQDAMHPAMAKRTKDTKAWLDNYVNGDGSMPFPDSPSYLHDYDSIVIRIVQLKKQVKQLQSQLR